MASRKLAHVTREITARLAGLGLGAALVLVSTAASADLATWSQERVTQYAEELATATGALYDELQAMPREAELSAEMYWQARDDVRSMHSSARHLARALKNGDDREKTAPTFARIQTLRRDAEENGRKAMIPDPVMAKVGPVGVALLKLRPYYQEEPE